MTTGFVFDPTFLDHDTGPGHPERRERLVATMDHLQQQPWFADLTKVGTRVAEPKWIETIHAPAYVAHADRLCEAEAPYLDVPDVAVCRRSSEIARLAAGGVLELVDRVIGGECHNGFALVRPPGHHAEQQMALGFCLFNNVAIAARYLQQQHGLDKILILDWDVHHGNGTQHTFEEDPSVLYVSLHQYPYYPGSGAHSETGIGRGAGATLNCPMPAGAGDAEYHWAFTEQILPRVEAFAPEAVLVSAGFDAHAADPLGQVNLSTDCFGWMSERVLEVAERSAGGRLISMLEGGYQLQALARCVARHLQVLAGVAPPPE